MDDEVFEDYDRELELALYKEYRDVVGQVQGFGEFGGAHVRLAPAVRRDHAPIGLRCVEDGGEDGGRIGVAALAEGLSAGLTAWVLSDPDPDAAWCALLFGSQPMPPAPLYLLSGGGSAAACIASAVPASSQNAWIEMRGIGRARF